MLVCLYATWHAHHQVRWSLLLFQLVRVYFLLLVGLGF